MVRKLSVGFYSFCGSGVHAQVAHELFLQDPLKYQSLLDIHYAPFLQAKNSHPPLDVAFVEGCIATEHQQKELQLIRKQAKKVILLGTDTINGHPHHQRNRFPVESFSPHEQSLMEQHQLKMIRTAPEVIAVDGKLHGNPIDPKELEKTIRHFCTEWGILEKKEGTFK